MTKPLPTTEEALSWIDKEIAKRKRIYEGLVRPIPDKLENYHDAAIASLLANRDVLVRHKETAPLSWLCGGCARYFEGDLVSEWPCETYLDILQRIAEVM